MAAMTFPVVSPGSMVMQTPWLDYPCLLNKLLDAFLQLFMVYALFLL